MLTFVLVGNQCVICAGIKALINEHFKISNVLVVESLFVFLTDHAHLSPDLIILIKTGTDQDLDFISAGLVKDLKSEVIAIFDTIPENYILANYLRVGISEFLTVEYSEGSLADVRRF